MVTKWYFRSSAASTGPTAKASTDTDDFPAVPPDKNTPLDMTVNKGTAQTSRQGAYSTGVNSKTMLRIFVGPALLAQTLTGAQANYIVGIGIKEGSNFMNLYHRTFVYVWRSGTGNAKTIIVPTSHLTEHGDAETGCLVTASGAAGDFVIVDGDRIVVEVWWDIQNTKSLFYTATDYYEGTTDVADGTATADAAGYFQCPQTLKVAYERASQEWIKDYDPTISEISRFTRTMQEWINDYDILTATYTPILIKSIQESIQDYDIISRLSSFRTQFQDNFTFTDSGFDTPKIVLLVKDYLKIFDIVTTSGGAAPSVKTVLDYLAVNDVFSQVSMFTKQMLDYTALTDLLSQISTFTKQMLDYIVLEDSYSNFSLFIKQMQDNLTLTDSLAVQLLYSRLVIDYLTLYDVVTASTGGVIVTTAILDFIKCYDLLSQVSIFPRTITDWLSTSDILAVRLLYSRILLDYIVLGDSYSNFATFMKQIQDYITLYDNASVRTLFSRVITDFIKYYDSFSQVSIILRRIQDYIALTDLLFKVSTFTKQMQDNIILTDSLEVRRLYSRLVIDYTALYDVVTASTGGITITTAVLDYIILADNTNLRTQFSKAIADWISASDILVTRLLYSRELLDYIVLGDSYSNFATFMKQMQDYTAINDSFVTAYVTYRQVTDWFIINDIPTFKSNFTRIITDSAQTFDMFTTFFITYREFIDWINTFDIKAQTSQFTRTFNDWIQIFDAFASQTLFTRLILECINIFTLERIFSYYLDSTWFTEHVNTLEDLLRGYSTIRKTERADP